MEDRLLSSGVKGDEGQSKPYRCEEDKKTMTLVQDHSERRFFTRVRNPANQDKVAVPTKRASMSKNLPRVCNPKAKIPAPKARLGRPRDAEKDQGVIT